MSETEVWLNIVFLLAGTVLGTAAGFGLERFYEYHWGERHDLKLSVDTSAREQGDIQTLIRLKNTGNVFEPNVNISIEAYVSIDTSLRFITVKSPTNDEIAITTDEDRFPKGRNLLSKFELAAGDVRKKDEILVRILSSDDIGTLTVIATAGSVYRRHKSFARPE